MITKNKVLLTVAILLLSIAAFLPAKAQITGPATVNNPKILVSLDPEYPGPGQSVTISLDSLSVDLPSAKISWSKNGTLVKSGQGDDSFNLTAGPIGSVTKISALVETAAGEYLEYETYIRPTAIDLVWESDSTVPPFYKGKALYGMLGTLRVIATPNMYTDDGTKIDSKNLFFKWQVNGQVLSNQTGLGRSAIVITDPIYRTPADIEVEVSTPDDQYAASGKISINTAPYRVNFYENSPVYGLLYNKALGRQFNLNENNISVEAFPYYFSVSSLKDPNLQYSWMLNGNNLTNQDSEISLSKSSGDQGLADLSVMIRNSSKFYQSSQAETNIIFGN